MTVNADQLENEANALGEQLLAPGSQQQDTVSQSAAQAPAPAPSSPQKDTAGAVDWQTRFVNAQSLMTKATMENAELRRQVEQLQAGQQAPESQPAGKQDYSSFKELVEDYPDLINPILQQFRTMEQRLNSVEQVGQQVTQTAENQAVDAYWTEVRAAHPDVDQIKADTKFQEWLSAQPPFIQQAANSPDPRGPVDVLNRYKQASPSRMEQAQALAEPQARSLPPQSRPATGHIDLNQIAQMSNEDFEKSEAEIDRLFMDQLVRLVQSGDTEVSHNAISYG